MTKNVIEVEKPKPKPKDLLYLPRPEVNLSQKKRGPTRLDELKADSDLKYLIEQRTKIETLKKQMGYILKGAAEKGLSTDWEKIKQNFNSSSLLAGLSAKDRVDDATAAKLLRDYFTD